MNKRRIYLDFAASTPVDKRVLSAMEPYWSSYEEDVALWANAVSMHTEGRRAREAVEGIRSKIAESMGAKKDEIIFTSGGTEGNNMAIWGIVNHFLFEKGMALSDIHLVVCTTEHPSVRDIFTVLEKRGADVTYLVVDGEGRVSSEELDSSIKENTVLVSIAYANNETGVVQPIKELARVVKEKSSARKVPVYFHTDATQAPLFLNCESSYLGVDLATFDAHKLYAPKGVGFLYKKRSVPIYPLFQGGSQEMNLRPGTVATGLIVGLGRAFTLALSERKLFSEEMRKLQDYFIGSLSREVPNAVLNGHRKYRLPNNANISIPGIESIFFLVVLDREGIAAAARSACLGESADGSHVLYAMGKGDAEARSSLRFTFGKTTTKEELNAVTAVLKREVEKLRD